MHEDRGKSAGEIFSLNILSHKWCFVDARYGDTLVGESRQNDFFSLSRYNATGLVVQTRSHDMLEHHTVFRRRVDGVLLPCALFHSAGLNTHRRQCILCKPVDHRIHRIERFPYKYDSMLCPSRMTIIPLKRRYCIRTINSRCAGAL